MLDPFAEIWDLHTHLSGVPGRTPDERMAKLMEYADRMGIARLVTFMGMEWEYEPGPEKLRTENDEALQALSHWHHRAFGFVYLNPAFTKQSLEELERCVENGPMVGVKLWVAMHCNAPELDAIVARAAALKAVIFQHTWIKITGNLPGESTPMDLAELAARHPEATFICGHTGGDWELGIRAVCAQKNIYVDLGGGDPASGFTEMAVRELGPERVLFGSDAGGRSFASQLAKVYSAQISDEAKRMVLGENLKRILLPILSAKGVSI